MCPSESLYAKNHPPHGSHVLIWVSGPCRGMPTASMSLNLVGAGLNPPSRIISLSSKWDRGPLHNGLNPLELRSNGINPIVPLYVSLLVTRDATRLPTCTLSR